MSQTMADHVRHLQERLKAAELGWQPIETAPKDQFILVYCPEDDTRWLAKWQGGEWHGVDEFGLTRTAGGPEYVTGWKVTHWTPLPAPPTP